jgi:ribose transport system substrate-binding protein
MHSQLNARKGGFAALLMTAILAAAAYGGSSVAQASTISRIASSSSSKAEITAAKAALAPYVAHPSTFPVTQKLKEKPPAGTTIAYLECGAPTCAMFAKDLQASTAALGAKLDVISAGLFSSTVQSAANAALAEHPSAVIVAGTTLSEFGGTLAALEKAGIPVFGIGVTGGKAYGLTAVSGGQNDDVKVGQLMADWVLVHKGANAHVVFFGAPELSYSPYAWNAFDAQLKKICPTCSAVESELSVLTYGSSAPSTVVSYLRANPSVNTTVFATEEGATGLPSALSAAGLTHITTFGFAPSAVNLSDIKAGKLSGGVGLDFDTEVWQITDVIAKTLTHQKVGATEQGGVIEILKSSNVTSADVKNGWSGYPNVAKRFASLWP